MLDTSSGWPVLVAPATWQTVDFISDLHLQAGEPATVEAWRRFMYETQADAVIMLGDLFEVWVGDDAAATGFEADCAGFLREVSRRTALYFMHGNRDFLLGRVFLGDCHITLLEDPTILRFADQSWLLTHGDALCQGDLDYMAFRAEVRTPLWQQAFLAKPLTERKFIARGLRDASELRKRNGLAAYADVDTAAARLWLDAAQALVMIHGHTHQPALHDLGEGRQRVVLSDWDAGAHPPRQQVLRLTVNGLERLDWH